jgi:hypothetical protein
LTKAVHVLYSPGMKSKLRFKQYVPDPPWTPFCLAEISPEQRALIDKLHEKSPLTQIWINSRYEVWVFEWPADQSPIKCPITQLSIKKRFTKDVIRDWRDLQRIKNEILGPNREAVELFPSEQRLMDTSNQYHLWALPEGQMFPFGYWSRVVSEETGDSTARQRPFDKDVRPTDLIDLTKEHLDLLKLK